MALGFEWPLDELDVTGMTLMEQFSPIAEVDL